jgi:glycosyltransferase involved in cell wall biosynthesis
MKTENGNLVSIIIPTYNYAQYLEECIKSVLHQTYQAFEIIIVDDGSEDDTRRLVQSIDDHRIRYIFQGHRGCYFARNAGLDAAKGNFIAFLDADDIWLPEKLQKQIDVFQNNKNIGVCWTHYDDLIETSLNIIPKAKHKEMPSCNDINTQNILRMMLLKSGNMNTSTVMAKLHCIKQIGTFDTKYQNAMDFDLWLRLIFNFKSYYINEVCALRRIHASNHSLKRLELHKGVFHSLNKIRANKDQYRYFSDFYDYFLQQRIMQLQSLFEKHRINVT